MGLTRARLAIYEVATMVTIQNMKDQRESTLLKDFCLRRLFPEDMTELKVTLVPLLEIVQSDPTRLHNLQTTPYWDLFIIQRWRVMHVLIYLMSEGRAYSNEDLDTFLFAIAS